MSGKHAVPVDACWPQRGEQLRSATRLTSSPQPDGATTMQSQAGGGGFRGDKQVRRESCPGTRSVPADSKWEKWAAPSGGQEPTPSAWGSSPGKEGALFPLSVPVNSGFSGLLNCQSMSTCAVGT